MKKKYIGIIVIFIIVLVTLIVLFQRKDKKENNIESIESKVNSIIENMTIDQKISQMLIIYYESNEIDENLIEILNEKPFGGFILMKKNITTYDATKKFVSDLKEYSQIPLIIGIDEEGGSVQRLKYLEDASFTDIPYMYDLGKTNNKDLAYEVGKVIAEEVRTIGVNVVFAPVVDIYLNKNNTVIGKRSFSENPNVVSEMAISLAKGLEDNKVIATYKHFPGHGDTSIDSHYKLPIIDKTYKEIRETELIPFKSAIDNNAKIIMIGHIALPKVTGDNTPASLSKTLITDILKENMKYDGLVITDALDMGALTNIYTEKEIYTKAIEAGVDLLLMPTDYENAISYIKKNILEERINESVKKILQFKYTYLEDYEVLDKSFLGSIEHKQVISKIKNN